jgi:dTDP-4-amino-4,6-dideoxygalactose transaminase
MSDQIPLFKVFMAPEATPAVAEVLASGYVGQGPKVDALEIALKREFDAERDVLTLNSCTSALDLALTLCDTRDFRHFPLVISTPMTCSATNSPMVTKQGTIAWADVDPITGLIDPESVARVLADLAVPPDAVIAVDWAGRMCDYNRLREVCAPYGVPIIEDAAHAPLATYNGRYQTRVGGDYIAWSWQAIKHLSTGDGGGLLCPDEATTERARLLRWYGLDRKSKADFRCEQDITEVGFKYHMNDIAAAIGLANLPHLREVVKRHRDNARAYHGLLEGTPGVTLPPFDPGSSAWLFTILVDDRADFQAYMAEHGVATSQVHRRNDEHPAFKAAEHPASDARPGLDHFAAHQVSIPVGWWLKDEDVTRIAHLVQTWARARERVAA